MINENSLDSFWNGITLLFSFYRLFCVRVRARAHVRLLACVCKLECIDLKKNVLHFGYFTWNNFSRQLRPLPLEIAETVKLTEKVRKVETLLTLTFGTGYDHVKYWIFHISHFRYTLVCMMCFVIQTGMTILMCSHATNTRKTKINKQEIHGMCEYMLACNTSLLSSLKSTVFRIGHVI